MLYQIVHRTSEDVNPKRFPFGIFLSDVGVMISRYCNLLDYYLWNDSYGQLLLIPIYVLGLITERRKEMTNKQNMTESLLCFYVCIFCVMFNGTVCAQNVLLSWTAPHGLRSLASNLSCLVYIVKFYPGLC